MMDNCANCMNYRRMNIDNKINQVLTKIEFDKKRFRVQQTQDIDPVRKASRDDRTDNWNGFSHDRLMRKLGRIPSVFLYDPNWQDLNSNDRKTFEKAARRFFAEHPEFRTCNNNF